MNFRLMTETLIAIVIAFMSFGIGRHSKQCPRITPGVITVRDTVERHDTVKITSYRDNIKTIEKPITQYKIVHDTIKVVTENVECYQIDTTTADGAGIVAELCSKIFPPDRPVDLVGHIFYKAPPDTHRTLLRIDTVNSPHLWRDVKICGLSFVIGGLGGFIIPKLLK